MLKPGDLVVVMQPEQTPLIDYHLPAGLRYATPLGRGEEPARDGLARREEELENATTAAEPGTAA